MGYLKTPESDQLTLPSDPAYWVRMKRRASWGDSSAAQSAMVKVSPAALPANGNGADPTAEILNEVELAAYLHTLVARSLVEWNITDDQERPVPINVKTVALLDPQDGDFLALEAQKRLGGRSAAQQGPFKKPSGRQSTAIKSETPKSSG
jgi:hypothetical protein